MKYSKAFIPTLKEEPKEAELASHALTLRAGLIRKIASGIYAFLPAGIRVIQKIEQIIREEMNRAGAIELLLPVMQPSDLWEKSGRWGDYGRELFRLKDRNNRSFCLGPTHEEIITHLAYLDIKSYKDLPLNLYQIQVKFRDEIRPRYGLLRGREFIMKDGYSFCENEEELDEIYMKMYEGYSRIIERLGLRFKAVEADTGLIGGKSSHEFHILAGDGEETLVYCQDCGYSANMDMAAYRSSKDDIYTDEIIADIEEISTPEITDIESLSEFLKVEKYKTAKTMLLNDEDSGIYAFVIAGDRELNLAKAEKYLGKQLKLYDGSDGKFVIGYIGPSGLDDDIEIYIDDHLKEAKSIITGANKKDYHLKNINPGRDIKIKAYGDFSYPVPGDLCRKCGCTLKVEKGIEVGHIFKLGKKYSEKMDTKYLDRDGKLKPFIMGCYGIGVTRMMSAAIEQLHDGKGIVWPPSIAPYLVSLVVTSSKSDELSNAGEKIYQELIDSAVEVLYDDRKISAGIKFKDSDLLGLPLRLVVGKKYIEKKLVEVQFRKSGDMLEVPLDGVVEFVKDFRSKNIKK